MLAQVSNCCAPPIFGTVEVPLPSFKLPPEPLEPPKLAQSGEEDNDPKDSLKDDDEVVKLPLLLLSFLDKASSLSQSLPSGGTLGNAIDCGKTALSRLT